MGSKVDKGVKMVFEPRKRKTKGKKLVGAMDPKTFRLHAESWPEPTRPITRDTHGTAGMKPGVARRFEKIVEPVITTTDLRTGRVVRPRLENKPERNRGIFDRLKRRMLSKPKPAV